MGLFYKKALLLYPYKREETYTEMKEQQLTKRQIEILLLLYKFRFLHTYQFQKLLHHKKPNRIKVWLKDLTEKQYIKKDYSPETIKKKPAIYSLTIKARELLKKRTECNIYVLNKIYREKNRSKTFVDHCIQIADIFLKLQSQTTEKIYFATKNDLTGYNYFPDQLPDAYIAIKTSENTSRYFLEILDENMPRFALRSKIRRYLDYYQSDQWEEQTNKPFPTVLVITSTDAVKKFMSRFIATTLEEEQVEINFQLATREEINKNGVFKTAYAIVPLG